MAPEFEIRRLGVADVADYRAIRLAALQEAPDAFGSLHEVEAAQPEAAFRERLATSAVFAAYAGQSVMGMVGTKQHTGPRERHKGFVWGMYVRPEARGRGVGAALLQAAMADAAESVEQLTLTVAQGNDAALALYCRLGFRTYGIEPRALTTPTGYADEVLMACILRPG